MATSTRKSGLKRSAFLNTMSSNFAHFHSVVMPILAISFAYLGAIVPRFYTPKPSQQPPKDYNISEVSTVWGKGAFLAWLLVVVSIQFDFLLGRRSALEETRWISMLCYSLGAFAMQLHYTRNHEFGPSYAAARYVADKSYESLAIIYFIASAKAFEKYLRESDAGILAPVGPRNRLFTHLTWPCYLFGALWTLTRLLHRADTVYKWPDQLKANQLQMASAKWNLWHIPPKYAPLLSISGVVLSTALLYRFVARGSKLRRLVYAIPAGVWFGFAILHVGICNAPTALALAPSKWADPEQIVALCAAGLIFLWGLLKPFYKEQGEGHRQILPPRRTRTL
ncbi:hypothetical protein VTL71DRAFT_4211 [Oculimacula yallundae]|uniref:Uncharacterized protein n=1 Tax=Oculimacula yallundae TaxID=86028 RepID=A0ABR4C6W9_9HELO